jgi:hypothetical protein
VSRTIARAAAVGLVLLAACADDAGGQVGGGATGVELTATATRSSLFDSQRTFRLELTNDGDAPVTVASVQLDSPLFEPVPASSRDTQLAPGQRLLLPVPYGPSICPGAGPSNLVTLVSGDEVVVPLGQLPVGVMDALHEVECGEAAVRDAADVAFGDDWTSTGARSARGEVVVATHGETEVTVDGMRGNIVFGVRGADTDPPLLTVAGAGEIGRLPLELVVDRCDTHALIESKRTFKFPLEVRLDGGPPALVVLEAEPGSPSRDVLGGLIQACIG